MYGMEKMLIGKNNK